MARILSIEDDEDIQHLIGRVLFQEGYDVHYAWNGEEGFEKILFLKPDLIILDLMLPRMNGVEVLKKLRSTERLAHIPVIVATAHGDAAGMLASAMDALGAQRYLRKPIDFNEMISMVRQVLADFPPAAAAPAARRLRKGTIVADPGQRAVWINDRLVATLTAKEFSLLERLMAGSGAVAKEELLRSLSYAPDQADALKQAVHRLRRELGPSESRRIRSTTAGYELIS